MTINLKTSKQKDKRSILNILKETESQFKNMGIASPRLDAEVLFSYYLSKDRSFLYTNQEYVLTDEELREFGRGVVRRLKGEPVAYITGRKEFWSLEFEVNNTVLIPRPETEILVEEILRLSGQRKPLNGKILEI
jgi:release factor glutamine methyltransferase